MKLSIPENTNRKSYRASWLAMLLRWPEVSKIALGTYWLRHLTTRLLPAAHLYCGAYRSTQPSPSEERQNEYQLAGRVIITNGDGELPSADSQPKSIGLVWGLAATLRLVYIYQMNRWTLSRWQHHKHHRSYYYYYYYYYCCCCYYFYPR